MAWWTNTAKHLWRSYFTIQSIPPQSRSPASKRKFAVCDQVFNSIPTVDQDIIRILLSHSYADSDADIIRCAKHLSLPPNYVYSVHHNALHSVIVQLGIIDKKEGESID